MLTPKQKASIEARISLIAYAKQIVADCDTLSAAFFKTQDLEKQKQIMWTYIRKREILRDTYKEIGEMRANEHA